VCVLDRSTHRQPIEIPGDIESAECEQRPHDRPIGKDADQFLFARDADLRVARIEHPTQRRLEREVVIDRLEAIVDR